MSVFVYKAVKSSNDKSGKLQKFSKNGELLEVKVFDLTDKDELAKYSTLLVKRLGGGGIRKK